MSEFRDSPLSMADVFHVALYKLMISTPTSTAHKPSITRRAAPARKLIWGPGCAVYAENTLRQLLCVLLYMYFKVIHLKSITTV